MIREENLYNLYDSVIERKNLTNKELNKCGFNYNDIQKLVNADLIQKIGDELYSFEKVDNLYNYGRMLLIEKQYPKANQCFQRCLEINPKYPNALLQLFLRSIKNEDYLQTFKLYDALREIENEKLKKDVLYYLYLLSIIIDIPEKYESYIKNLKIEDITYINNDMKNKIRTFAFNKRFSQAYNAFKKVHYENNASNIIEKELLLKATKKECISKNIIASLVKEKKYKEIIDYLSEKQQKNSLSLVDVYTLKLAQKYVEMDSSSTILKRKNTESNNLYKLIDYNNFDRALKISEEHTIINNIDKDKNITYLILKDLCDLINKLNKNNEVDTIKVESTDIIHSDKVEIPETINISDYNLINKKYNELLENKTVVLLKTMDELRINNLIKILENYSNVESFVIKDGYDNRLVLKYKLNIEEFIDINSTTTIGNKAYRENDYITCINEYTKLLHYFSKPKFFVYSKLGLAHMKMGNTDEAIKYLTIASFLAKEENLDVTYDEVILRLKGDITEEDAKIRFKMSESDFDYSDINNFYGIDNFKEINDYIISSQLDLENACLSLGLNTIQIDIIKLIYAREHFLKGNIDKGELYLHSYERSKNKTKETLKLFNEIRMNKLFYKNRLIEESRNIELPKVMKKKYR